MRRFIWTWTVCLVGLATIAAVAYLLITWQRGLILAGNWQAWVLFMAFWFVLMGAIDLYRHGETSLFGWKIRPMWRNASSPAPLTEPAKVVDLHSHEYRRER